MSNMRGFGSELTRPLHSSRPSWITSTITSFGFQISRNTRRPPMFTFSRIFITSEASVPEFAYSLTAHSMPTLPVRPRIAEGAMRWRIGDIGLSRSRPMPPLLTKSAGIRRCSVQFRRPNRSVSYWDPWLLLPTALAEREERFYHQAWRWNSISKDRHKAASTATPEEQKCVTAMGHEERFPPTKLSAGCGFRKETIAGMRRNGRDAP